jgi:endogenous inhibitor of DNA gyrase (YacG/DUF329 family)
MYLPFCSKRCKYVDLGAWLDSEYRLICEAAPDQDNSTDTPWEKSSDEQ